MSFLKRLITLTLTVSFFILLYALPSNALSSSNITVTNNAVGTKDIVVINGLTKGDKVQVYSDSEAVTLLGSATAALSGVATVKIKQIGADCGTIYLTVKSIDGTVSDIVSVNFEAEQQTGELDASKITVANNAAGTKDTVVVTGLAKGDKIQVYAAGEAGTLLGSASALSAGTATVKSTQIGADTGTIYVTNTRLGLLESDPIGIAFNAEQQTGELDAASVTVINNAEGTKDNVCVTDLTKGDKIRVYADSGAGTLLGSAKASFSGTVTVQITQISADTGTIYVTNTGSGLLESNPLMIAFDAEQQSEELDADNITVTNNAGGTKDTVVVTGLTKGDRVQVYADSAAETLLGSAKAPSSGIATVKIAQIGADGGSFYMTNTSSGLLESVPLMISFDAEQQSGELDADNITVTNNAKGMKDIVVVTGLTSGDIFRVYAESAAETLLGSAKASSAGTATVKITQIGAEGGNLYVTNISSGLVESDPICICFDAEEKTDALTGNNNITVTNAAGGTKDTVTVTGLTKGDIIKVYADSAATVLLGSATASASGTATAKISQIGAGEGTIYVTNTSLGLLESDVLAASFVAEEQTDALTGSSPITIINNIQSTKDTILVSGLKQSDRIKVYADIEKKYQLSSAMACSAGTVTIKIAQLGADGGTVYLTVTSAGKYESEVYAATFLAESQSATLNDESSITVNNYVSGMKDTVVVAGLAKGDIIKVYGDDTKETLLGSATSGSSGAVTIKVAQLGAEGGSIYLTITCYGQYESDVYAVTFESE